MSSILSVKKITSLKEKRVLVRVDFNVAMKNGSVADDEKLKASLPTISYLIGKGAKVILVSHLGRPDGKRVESLSLAPVAKRLVKLIQAPVKHLPYYEGAQVEHAVSEMGPGEIIMLENIRFSSQEQGDKGNFARELASLADVFVLDGFAVAHRGDASVSGVARFLPSYAGLLLEKEINGLAKVTKNPISPFVAIIGGAKMETKIPVINALLPKVDALLVGGGILNTYLKGLGYGVGDSLVDKDYMADAIAYGKKRKIVWPVDVIVGKKNSLHGRHVMLETQPHQICKKGEAIFDIGPETVRLFAGYIYMAKTLVWNGAMGWFEQKPFDFGTLSVARLLAARSKGKAFGVIGGGETVQSMEMVGMTDDVDLVSTGGGAMLEFLAGKKLPGIEALKRKSK